MGIMNHGGRTAQSLQIQRHELGNVAVVLNDQAAIAFLHQAVFWLEAAQAGGADVTTLIALLEQVIAALSAA